MKPRAIGDSETSVNLRIALACGALVFGVCLAVIRIPPAEPYWIVDSAAKGLMAERLLASGYRDFSFEHPGGREDPTGRFFPVPGYAVPFGDRFISIFPVAYSAVAAPFAALLGPLGLRVPAALGVSACAALLTGWLIPVVGRAWATGAAMVLALASPLFFYGITVWEHSLTAALSLAAWMLSTRPDLRRLLAAGGLIALAIWLRSELALMGIALASVLVFRWRRAMPLMALAVGAIPALVALLAFNHNVYGDMVGPHISQNVRPADVFSAFDVNELLIRCRVLMSLLGGVGSDTGDTWALGLAVVLAWGTGLLAASRNARLGTWIALSLSLAAWVVGFREIIEATQPLAAVVRFNGLLVQMPLAGLAGVGFVAAWRNPDYRELRWGLLTGVVYIGLVLLVGISVHTAFAAGVHWGPRVLVPAFPALVVFAVAALRDIEVVQPRAAWAATALLTIAGVSSSVLAAGILIEQKRETARLEKKIRSQPAQVLVVNDALFAQHLVGLWDDKQILRAHNRATLQKLRRSLGARGLKSFLLFAPVNTGFGHGIADPPCRIRAQQRGARVHYLDGQLIECATLRGP